MMKRTATWTTAGIAAGVAFMMLSFNHMPGGSNVAPNVALQPQQQLVQPNRKASQITPEVAHVPMVDEKRNGSNSEAVPEVAEVPTTAPQIKAADSTASVQQKAGPKQQVANKENDHNIASEKIHTNAPQEIANAAVEQNSAAKQKVDQNDAQIAEAPPVTLNQKGSSDDVVALYDGGQNPAEELGMATDEDGLYAIKL
jgi:type IV secretory pathway VirJ component